MLTKFLFLFYYPRASTVSGALYWNAQHTVKLPFKFTKQKNFANSIQGKLYFISISLSHCTANLSASISHTIMTCCGNKFYLF